MAWRPPLANAKEPLTRQPPSTGTARAFGPGPQASTARGSRPNISPATSGATKAAIIEQTEFWHRHQAVLASWRAISAIVSTKETGSLSPPP